MIELLQPISLAPERVSKRSSAPPPALQHVAYAVPASDVADVRRSLDERGLSVYLRSQLGEVVTTLHEASALLGHDLEINADSEALRTFFGMVSGGGEGWDGSESLRRVET